MDVSGPHPVMNPWITIPTMLEMTQYRASPLSNWVVKNPNISGIIHNIMRLVDCCLGSADGIVVTFCISHIDKPTSIGRIGVGSGAPRSSHRNEASSGTSSCINGNCR